MHQPDFVPVPPRRAPARLSFPSRLLPLAGLCFLLLGVMAFGGFGHSAVAQAVEATVFGPETFKRETGKPKPVIRSFLVADPADAFTLVIENGTNGKNRVTSASVELNGGLIVGPAAFDQSVGRLQVPVWLWAANQIAVEVRGQPGTLLKVWIVGRSRQQPVQVPPVAGLTVSEAEAELSAVGLTLGTVGRQTSLTVDKDRIITQSPAASTAVVPGTAVDVVVSVGPVEATLDRAGGEVTAPGAAGARLVLTLPPDATFNPVTLRIAAIDAAGASARFRIESTQNEFRRPLQFRVELPPGQPAPAGSALRLGPPNNRIPLPTTVQPGGTAYTATTFSLAAEPWIVAPVAASTNVWSWLPRVALADELPESNGLFTELELARIECNNEMDSLHQRLAATRSFPSFPLGSAPLLIAEIKAVDLMCGSDPVSQARWEAEREFVELVACEKYEAAMDAMALFYPPPDNLAALRQVIRDVLNGAAVRDVVDAQCPGGQSEDWASALDAYVADFIPVFTPTVVNQVLGDGPWRQLWGQLREVEGLLADAAALGLTAAEASVRQHLIPPVLDAYRRLAYRSCVVDQTQQQLADLLSGGLVYGHSVTPSPLPRVFPNEAPFTEADLVNDIQRCGTTLTIKAFDPTDPLGTAGYTAPNQPGPPPAPGRLEMPPDGAVQIGGLVPAFRCLAPNGPLTIGSDELVIRLNGVEVARRGHANGTLPATAIDLDADALFTPAGVEAADGQVHTLTIHREGPACGATVPGAYGPEAYELYRVELQIGKPKALVSVDSVTIQTFAECRAEARAAGGPGVPNSEIEVLGINSGTVSPVICEASSGAATAKARFDFALHAPTLVAGQPVPGNAVSVRSQLKEVAEVAAPYSTSVAYNPEATVAGMNALTFFSAKFLVGAAPVNLVAKAHTEGVSDDVVIYDPAVHVAQVRMEIFDAGGNKMGLTQARWRSVQTPISNDDCPSCSESFDEVVRLEPGWTVLVTGRVYGNGAHLNSVYVSVGYPSSSEDTLGYSLDLHFDPL